MDSQKLLRTLTIIFIVILSVLLIQRFRDFSYNLPTHKPCCVTSGCKCGENCKCNKMDTKLINLWMQHFLYTKLVIDAFFDTKKSVKQHSDRLLQNQRDIGDHMREMFGLQVGDTITKELTKHIEIASKLLAAVKSGNRVDQKKLIGEFYANANDIGVYLDELLKTQKYAHHMKMHIKTLIDNVLAHVTAISTDNYHKDIQTLDVYTDAGIEMAFDMAADVM